MMNREIKFQANQGGSFTVAQNRVSFTLPPSGVYDLSKSYINLNVQIDVTENETLSGTGIYNMDLGWTQGAGGEFPKFNNVSLVKNAVMRTGVGSVENIRRVDILKQLMLTYETTFEENSSKSYQTSNQIGMPITSFHSTIFRDLVKEGTIKSKNNSIQPVKIPLGDIWDFCFQAEEFDAGKAQGATMELELNIDRVSSVHRSNLDFAAAEIKEFEDITAVGVANTVITKAKTTSIAQSPYHTSQKLKISATHTDGGGSNIVDQEVVIASISRNTTTGAISLTFETNWGNLDAGKTYSDITIVKETPASSTANFNFAEIVVVALPKTSSDIDVIEFDTYSTEETNGNNLQSFQNQYEVEPDCDGVVIAFPTDTDLVSRLSGLASYRLRLDNEDLTDRDVLKNTPLYYDRINMTLTNFQMRMKNVYQNNGNTESAWDSVYGEDNLDVTSIMSPLVQKEQPFFKQLQVNISATLDPPNGVGKLVLFKHLPREFRYGK